VTRTEVDDDEVSAENFAGLVFLDPEKKSWDVSVFDRAVLRGDGFFEAVSVIDGKIPVSLDLHLERLAVSAAALDMPRPDLEAFKTACLEMIARYSGGHDDPMLRIVVSRGLDFGTGMGKRLGAGIPSVWMYIDGEGERHSTDPVTMVSLTAGFDSNSSAMAPWLLRGAKTLSYAVNMAAEREARRRGMTDALFVTTDKFVLESPHASVVARFGDTLVTPDPAIGVLHGTTQQELFAYGRRIGLRTHYRDVNLAEMKQADAVYQTRGGWVIPVSTLDTEEFTVDQVFVAAANQAIHYEREAQEEELLNDDYGL
jgi:4-amino-4-deoxychorismate lyase